MVKLVSVITNHKVMINKAFECIVLNWQDYKKLPLINEKVNLYEATEKEILLMDDAIQVKGQKAARDNKKDKEKQILEVDSQSNGAADKKIWVRMMSSC